MNIKLIYRSVSVSFLLLILISFPVYSLGNQFSYQEFSNGYFNKKSNTFKIVSKLLTDHKYRELYDFVKIHANRGDIQAKWLLVLSYSNFWVESSNEEFKVLAINESLDLAMIGHKSGVGFIERLYADQSVKDQYLIKDDKALACWETAFKQLSMKLRRDASIKCFSISSELKEIREEKQNFNKKNIDNKVKSLKIVERKKREKKEYIKIK